MPDPAPLAPEEAEALRALLRAYATDQTKLLNMIQEVKSAAPKSTLRAALAKAQENAAAVEKVSPGKFGKYASTEHILLATKEAFAGLGVWWRGKRCPIHRNPNGEAVSITRVIAFTNESGEEVEAETDWGVDLIRTKEGTPTRSEEKSVAAAQTASLGYILRDALGLPRLKEEDMDTHNEVPAKGGSKEPDPDLLNLVAEVKQLAAKLKEAGVATPELVALVRKACGNPAAVAENGRFDFTTREAEEAIHGLTKELRRRTSAMPDEVGLFRRTGENQSEAGPEEVKKWAEEYRTALSRVAEMAGLGMVAENDAATVKNRLAMLKASGYTLKANTTGSTSGSSAPSSPPPSSPPAHTAPPANAALAAPPAGRIVSREKVDRLANAAAGAVNAYGTAKGVMVGLLRQWAGRPGVVEDAGKFAASTITEAEFAAMAAGFKKWEASTREALRGAKPPDEKVADASAAMEEWEAASKEGRRGEGPGPMQRAMRLRDDEVPF